MSPRRRLALASLPLAAMVASTGCLVLPQTTAQPANPNDPTYQGAVASAEESQIEGTPPVPGGGASEPSAAPEPPKAAPTSVEIRSECSKTVPVFYGEKPKFGSGTRSSVSSNSISSAGRKADGTLTVWIIDEQENGVASAKVTPETRRVVIDRSCAAIRAE